MTDAERRDMTEADHVAAGRADGRKLKALQALSHKLDQVWQHSDLQRAVRRLLAAERQANPRGSEATEILKFIATADDIKVAIEATHKVIRQARTAPWFYATPAQLARHLALYGAMEPEAAALAMLTECRDMTREAMQDALADHWMTPTEYDAALPGARAEWFYRESEKLDAFNLDLSCSGMIPFEELAATPIVSRPMHCDDLATRIGVEHHTLCALCERRCDGPTDGGSPADDSAPSRMLWPAFSRTPALCIED